MTVANNTLAPTDAEILALLPTVKLKDEDPKRMVWLTRKDALKFVRAVMVKWGTPAHASQPVATPAGMKPYAFMFQHEETGLTQFVDAQQVEWGFEKNNPRLKSIGPVFTAAQVQAMGRVPPGWQVVPVELDDDIAEAIAMTANCCGGGAYDIWRAALAAAPSGPVLEPLTDEQVEDLWGEANRGICVEREDYFNAFRDAEAAHGITAAPNGGQHGTE